MIRIATWNLERPLGFSGFRSRSILKKIKEIGADIWILTETHDAIVPDDGYHVESSPTISSPPISHAEGEHKSSIWSRWPIVEQIETSNFHRSVCVTLQAVQGCVVVYGTVIPYHGAKWPYGTPRKWDAHYAAIATQGADWLRVRRRYPASCFITGGDFNKTRIGRYTYGTKWGRKLLDLALEECGAIGVTQSDFALANELTQREQEILARNIDHICLDRKSAAQVQNIGVWEGKTTEGEHLSDHSGVFVDLAI